MSFGFGGGKGEVEEKNKEKPDLGEIMDTTAKSQRGFPKPALRARL